MVEHLLIILSVVPNDNKVELIIPFGDPTQKNSPVDVHHSNNYSTITLIAVNL